MNDLRKYIRSLIEWHDHLENVIEPEEELPFDNDPEAPSWEENPMNPYDANNSLRKVKASVPGTQSRNAGVKKGGGPITRGRHPGGFRSSAFMKQGF